MTELGRLVEIWRYPVKSMGGEQIESCEVGPGYGVPGDRSWALRDEVAGEIRGAKRMPELLRCSARTLEEPRGPAVPPIEIAFPDGRRISGDAAEVHEALGRTVGRRVTLCARRPAADREHYRRREPVRDEGELRAQLGLLPDEPLPARDFSPELQTFTSPPGTYFDAHDLHLLSWASLSTLARAVPDARVDVRRFRPNLVVDTGKGGAALPEIDWCGQTVRIGEALLRIDAPTLRCVMTTCAQGDLPKEPSIMRALVKETGQDLGVGVRVLRAGSLRLGDRVERIGDGAAV